jgi:hypothetical protein
VKLLLDVEHDQIVIDIPDQAMRLDLAAGQGAGNLNQITDLYRMPRQQGATPARGQSRSRGPGLGPARPRIVDRSLEGCNPIRQDDPMNRVVLIQLTDFGLSSKQRCPASRQVPLDPLRGTRLGGRDVKSKQMASFLVWYWLPHQHRAEAIISHPGNDRVPRRSLDLYPETGLNDG